MYLWLDVLFDLCLVFQLPCVFLVCFRGSSPKLMSEQQRGTPQKRKGSKGGRGCGNRRAVPGEDEGVESDDPAPSDDENDDDDRA